MTATTGAYLDVMTTARGRLLRQREDLLRKRADRERVLAAMTRSQEDEGTIASHIADAATDLLVAQTHVGELARIDQALAAVDAALARLENGTYGVCIECGEMIDPARLKALPAAKRCLRCQTYHEYRTAS